MSTLRVIAAALLIAAAGYVTAQENCQTVTSMDGYSYVACPVRSLHKPDGTADLDPARQCSSIGLKASAFRRPSDLSTIAAFLPFILDQRYWAGLSEVVKNGKPASSTNSKAEKESDSCFILALSADGIAPIPVTCATSLLLSTHILCQGELQAQGVKVAHPLKRTDTAEDSDRSIDQQQVASASATPVSLEEDDEYLSQLELFERRAAVGVEQLVSNYEDPNGEEIPLRALASAFDRETGVADDSRLSEVSDRDIAEQQAADMVLDGPDLDEEVTDRGMNQMQQEVEKEVDPEDVLDRGIAEIQAVETMQHTPGDIDPTQSAKQRTKAGLLSNLVDMVEAAAQEYVIQVFGAQAGRSYIPSLETTRPLKDLAAKPTKTIAKDAMNGLLLPDGEVPGQDLTNEEEALLHADDMDTDVLMPQAPKVEQVHLENPTEQPSQQSSRKVNPGSASASSSAAPTQGNSVFQKFFRGIYADKSGGHMEQRPSAQEISGTDGLPSDEEEEEVYSDSLDSDWDLPEQNFEIEQEMYGGEYTMDFGDAAELAAYLRLALGVPEDYEEKGSESTEPAAYSFSDFQEARGTAAVDVVVPSPQRVPSKEEQAAQMRSRLGLRGAPQLGAASIAVGKADVPMAWAYLLGAVSEAGLLRWRSAQQASVAAVEDMFVQHDSLRQYGLTRLAMDLSSAAMFHDKLPTESTLTWAAHVNTLWNLEFMSKVLRPIGCRVAYEELSDDYRFDLKHAMATFGGLSKFQALMTLAAATAPEAGFVWWCVDPSTRQHAIVTTTLEDNPLTGSWAPPQCIPLLALPTLGLSGTKTASTAAAAAPKPAVKQAPLEVFFSGRGVAAATRVIRAMNGAQQPSSGARLAASRRRLMAAPRREQFIRGSSSISTRLPQPTAQDQAQPSFEPGLWGLVDWAQVVSNMELSERVMDTPEGESFDLGDLLRSAHVC